MGGANGAYLAPKAFSGLWSAIPLEHQVGWGEQIPDEVSFSRSHRPYEKVQRAHVHQREMGRIMLYRGREFNSGFETPKRGLLPIV